MSKGVEIPARIPIRRHGVARVEAILEAATKLFAERGLQGTTMSAVAEESGTAPGSLYRFFRNRDEVWDALLDRYVALRYDQLSELRACAPLMTTQELARHMVQDMQNRFQLRKLAMSFLEIRRIWRRGEGAAARNPETDRRCFASTRTGGRPGKAACYCTDGVTDAQDGRRP